MKKQKPYREMNTRELAAATREFDDPNYHPPARKPTKRELAKLHRVQRRAVVHARLTLSLDKKLVEQADSYAAAKGITVSQLISNVLKRLVARKSA